MYESTKLALNKIEELIPKVLDNPSVENIFELVYYSSKVYRQGVAATHEEVENTIQRGLDKFGSGM